MTTSIDLIKASARGGRAISTVVNAAPQKPKVWTSEEIEDLIGEIFAGTINDRELPESLYFAIADHLKEALYRGWGATLKDMQPGTKDLELLTELRDNIYIFSAAKVFHEVREMTDALVTNDGTIKSFSAFKKDATEIFETHNVNYLRTEYNTAIGQAQNAGKWNNIEKNKDVLPYLKYSAVEDANTSEICAPLDGICLPVDDDFWDEFMPLNHFNCRCTVEQLDEQDAKVTSAKEVEELSGKSGDEMDAMFKMNPGKDGVIFSDEHPYFDVAAKDRDFARNNFNLPIPESDDD